MIGFDLPLAAAKFVVLAGLSACPSQGRPSINVTLIPHDNPYNTRTSSKQLTLQDNKVLQNALGEKATEGQWMVGGLAKRNTRVEASFQGSSVTDPKTGMTCLQVRSVTYNIHHYAQIFVAADYKSMGCRYSQTLAHEKHHVQIDRIGLNAAIPAIRRSLQAYLDSKPLAAPVPAASLAAAQQSFLQGLNSAVQPQIEAAWRDIDHEQAKLDNYDAYKRDSALCPGQFPQFDGTPVAAAPRQTP